MNTIERAIEIIEDEHDPHFGPIDAPSLVYALNGAGLLVQDPPRPTQIIRTAEELEALDPDTVIETADRARVGAALARRWSDLHVPAVVLATGAHVRAARRALEGQQ